MRSSRGSGTRADSVLRRAGPVEIRSLLGSPPPEQAWDYGAILARVLTDVLPYASRTDHPGLFRLRAELHHVTDDAGRADGGRGQPVLRGVDGGGRRHPDRAGSHRLVPHVLGMPAGTAGVLVTGGSAASLTALLVAREAAGGPSDDSVVYLSDQAHSSLARTARAMGLRSRQVRVLPTDDRWRLSPEAVAAAVRADRRAGRVPVALCASAGSTNTGAVDPLGDLADVCAGEGLWLHVDAAYGGFAALTTKGRAVLAGIDRADSVTLDPHKWLFQPMECGSVLIRDGARLERTFAIHPDYLDDNDPRGDGEVNFADRGLQLSRGFRALKVWVSVQTFGLAAFRAAIQRNLELAELAEALVRGRDGLTLMAPAALGIVCFRRDWPGCDEAETERRGLALIDALKHSGTALVSGTRLAGRHTIRLCVLNPTSSADDVRRVIEHFAGAPPPPGRAGQARRRRRFAGGRCGGSGQGRAAEGAPARRRARLDHPGSPGPRRLPRRGRR
jgi:glutamate/tyrosine decarboxylase-like PLP-dependent enzyme